MEIVFQYQKQRRDFGRQCLFSDKGPDLTDNYPSNKKVFREYILKDPVSRSTQLAPLYAEDYINTVSAVFKNSGMNHAEGGWPKDVNCLDEEQTKRYRRKIEKEDSYHHVLMQLFKSMESNILQNNAVNIYQEYFADVPETPLLEKTSARTLNVYQDQKSPTRPVNHLSWSPDQNKFAVTHCNLVFQVFNKNVSPNSYIWEVENPNRPLHKLIPPDPSACIEFNLKDTNLLVSGQMNGQVAFWDLRKSSEPVGLSLKENSFLDPVQNVLWCHSKTNTEFFSSSSDGQVKWWDTRNLTTPVDELILDYAKEKDQRLSNALGASTLEYETTIPNRYMVGTEEGVLIMGNKKGKFAMDKMALRIPGAHFGPIYSIQRNPSYLKNFLTIGDWSAKIWSEDCRESPIMWIPIQKAALTDGAWSASRVSVFFTTRVDGTLDIWDFLQHQRKATLAVRVCDEKLTCLKPHDNGRIIIVGNSIGTTYLVELSKNMSGSSRSERALFAGMFERENRREKILEARNREIRLKHKTKMQAANKRNSISEIEENNPSFFDNVVKQAEMEFFQKLAETQGKTVEDEEATISKDSMKTDVASQSEYIDSEKSNY